MNKLLTVLGLLIALALHGEVDIAVSYLEGSKDIPEQKTEMYTNFLVGEIVNYPDVFNIRGKQKINIWENGKIINILSLKKTGKDLKARFVITGWLEKLPDIFLLKLAVVSTKKIEIGFQKEFECETESQIINSIKEFIHTFAEDVETKPLYKKINQQARGYWIVAESFLTLHWYGWAIPIALGIEDAQIIVASEMILPLSVLIGGLMMTKTLPVTNRHTISSLGGAYIGIADGFCLNAIFDIEDYPSIFLLPVGVSLLENIGGFYSADKFNLTEGEAEFPILTAGEGHLYGLGFAELFDVESSTGRGLLAVGTRIPSQFIGYKIANIREYTPADGEIILTAGLLGAATTCNLLFQFDVEDNKSYISGAMLGNIAGATIMDHIKGEKHFSRGSGILAYAGAYLGGLFGMGLNALFDIEDEKVFNIIPNLTAIGGFALTYNLMK